MKKIAFIGPLEKERLDVLTKILNKSIADRGEFLSLYNFKLDEESIQIWNFRWGRQGKTVFNLMVDTYDCIFVFFNLSESESLKATRDWLAKIDVNKVAYIGIDGENLLNMDEIKGFLDEIGVKRYVEVDLESGENLHSLRELMTKFSETFTLLASRREEKPVVKRIEGISFRGELISTPVMVSNKGIEKLSYEERIILRLCNGENTIEDIAKKLSIPRIKVALTIRKLVRRGIVREITTLK